MFPKKTQVQVFPTYHNTDDLHLAINNYLDSRRGLEFVDFKFSTNEVIAVTDGKGEKVIAYHAILIYKI